MYNDFYLEIKKFWLDYQQIRDQQFSVLRDVHKAFLMLIRKHRFPVGNCLYRNLSYICLTLHFVGWVLYYMPFRVKTLF